MLLPVFGAAAAIGSDESTTSRPTVADVLGEGGPILLTPEQSLHADAEVFAKAEGISQAEALERLEFQVETTAWLNKLDARKALGDGFAGSRVSLEERELVVYFKGKAPIGAVALQRGTVRVVEGQRYSLTDITTIHQHLAEVGLEIGFGEMTSSADLETQRFSVDVSEGAAQPASLGLSSVEAEVLIRSGLRDRFGVDLGSDEIVVTVHIGQLVDDQHSYGGAEVADDGHRKCTSAFAVEDSGTGTDGVLTAAHCEGINQIADNGNGNLYSAPFMREYYNSQGDFEFHTTTHWEFPIFYKSSSYASVVGSRIANNAISEDTWVCRYGRSSGQNCGYTDDITFAVTTYWPGCSCYRTVTDAVSVRGNTNNSQGGDSGGPWWIGTGALGVHKGNLPDHSRQYFSKIENAENRLNVDVLLCVPSC